MKTVDVKISAGKWERVWVKDYIYGRWNSFPGDRKILILSRNVPWSLRIAEILVREMTNLPFRMTWTLFSMKSQKILHQEDNQFPPSTTQILNIKAVKVIKKTSVGLLQIQQ